MRGKSKDRNMGSLGSKQKGPNSARTHQLMIQGGRGAGKTAICFRLSNPGFESKHEDFDTDFREYLYGYGGRMPLFHYVSLKFRSSTHQFSLMDSYVHPHQTTISGIVYCVDSSDRSTIDDVRVCLDTLLLRGDLKGIPLLVFANKQDIKGAMTPEEVEDALHLHNIKDRLYHVVGCSAMSGEGLTEGLEWFVKYRDTAKNRKYMEGPVKETLEDGKEVLKSGHSWLSSFFSRQTVKT